MDTIYLTLLLKHAHIYVLCCKYYNIAVVLKNQFLCNRSPSHLLAWLGQNKYKQVLASLYIIFYIIISHTVSTNSMRHGGVAHGVSIKPKISSIDATTVSDRVVYSLKNKIILMVDIWFGTESLRRLQKRPLECTIICSFLGKDSRRVSSYIFYLDFVRTNQLLPM